MKAENQTRPHCYLTPLSIRERIVREQPLGLPVINMAFNELPFAPSAAVAEAIAETALTGNRYGSPACPALHASLCLYYGVPADSIICGNGSEELLDVIARNFIRPGDEIVIPQFGYIQFELIANRMHAKLVKAAETQFTADADALIAAVTPATRLMFLANPNNPTGTLMPQAEVERLVQHLPAHVVLVLDLAYGEFAGFDYCSRMHQLVADNNNVVVTRTFSKAFGLAGLRAGWCHAPAWMIPGFYAARGMGTVNAFAQAAAVAGLQDIETVNQRVALIVAERKRIADTLQGMGVSSLPSHANFLLLSINDTEAGNAEQLVDYLFDTRGILVMCCREAGLEGFFRISISHQEHNNLLIEGVAEFLQQDNLKP